MTFGASVGRSLNSLNKGSGVELSLNLFKIKQNEITSMPNIINCL